MKLYSTYLASKNWSQMWTMHHYESDPANPSYIFNFKFLWECLEVYFKTQISNRYRQQIYSTSQAWLGATTTLSAEQIPLNCEDDTAQFKARKPWSDTTGWNLSRLAWIWGRGLLSTLPYSSSTPDAFLPNIWASILIDQTILGG